MIVKKFRANIEAVCDNYYTMKVMRSLILKGTWNYQEENYYDTEATP